MRVRRGLSESFSSLLIPAICCAVSLYFGYSGIFGERGLLAFSNTQGRLAVAERDLAEIRAKREALQHRISLLDGKAIDPDLLEEIARLMLLQTRPGEVAVPREKR